MYAGRRLTPDEFWRRQAELDGQVRESFPHWVTYGLVNWGGTSVLGEWPLGDGSFRSLRYDDGPDVTVVVACADGDVDQAVPHLLANLPGSLELRLDTSGALPERQESRLADAIDIPVSDMVTSFVGWTSGEFSVAGAGVGGVDIAVCWRGLDPTQLHVAPVDDVEPFLVGRRDLIRTARRKHGFDE